MNPFKVIVSSVSPNMIVKDEPAMSGTLDALHELGNDIREAYEQESRSIKRSRRSRQRRQSGDSVSVRDIHLVRQDSSQKLEGSSTTRKDMLAGWHSLVKALHRQKVFLNYTHILGLLFVQVSANLEEDTMQKITKLTELMTETIDNNAKPQAECCYVTLLEILASYCPEWSLSSDLESVWNGLGQTVNLNTPPENFRNMAYSILMSLPWKPDTQDLHWICQIEDGDSDSNDSSPPPAELQYLFDQISSTPLPRKGHVHRIVDWLKNKIPAAVAISSQLDDGGFHGKPRTNGGLGGTTLAAMVASHSSLQARFCVLWLPLRRDTPTMSGHQEMTFDRYTGYLNHLCEQLSATPDWPRPHYELEPPSLSSKREEERMLQAKRQMSQVLINQGKDILLVLDQVWDDQEIAWFRFIKEQSFLVTAETPNLSVDWTLEINALTEGEALELFLTESGYASTHVLKSSLEAKNTVQRCRYHPLTIRTVARWFRCIQEEVGVVKGLEEVNQTLSTCATKLLHSPTSESSESARILFEVMDLMLSPVSAVDGQQTKLMKLCLSSLAVVFSGRVPTPVVHLLWGQLLKSEPDAIEELGDKLKKSQVKKRVRIFSDALISMGLLSVTEEGDYSFLEIHHDMQAEFAVSLLKEVDFMGQTTQEEIVQRWHRAFVKAYFKSKKSDGEDVDPACKEYAAEKLVSHMFEANLLADIVDLLKEEDFLRDRLDHCGCVRGTELHVYDCRRLQGMMKRNSSVCEDQSQVLLSIYLTLASFLGGIPQGTDDECLEAAQALHCVGFALSGNRYWPEASECFKAALRLLPTAQACSLSITILHSLGTLQLANQDPEGSLKNANECMKILDGLDPSCKNYNVIYGLVLQKIGDALELLHDYRGAMDAYHTALEKFNKDPKESRVDVGKVFLRKGILHQRMGEHAMAMTVLEKCIKWKLKLGESSGELALAYSHLGDIYLETEATSDAMACFKQAIRLMEANANEVEENDMYMVAGKICEMNGDHKACLDAFDKALACHKAMPSSRMNKIRKLYDVCWVARIIMSHDDDERALATFDECLKDESDPNCLELAKIFFYRGEYCLKHGADDALLFFGQSLKIRRNKLGGNECVIENMKRIGHIHKSNGELVEAEKHFQDALRFSEKLYGEDSEEVVSLLYKIAELKKCAKDYSKALALLAECLDVQRRKLGDTHPEVAATLHSIGGIHVALGDYEKAFKRYLEALELRRGSFHHGDSILAETLHELGLVARKRGESEQALDFLLDALDKRKDLDDKRAQCETLAEMGHVHRLLDNLESAIGCYEKCLEILKQEFGDEDELVGDVYLSLGHTKKRSKQHEEAIECYQKALDARRAVHGDNHHNVAAALRSLGIVQYQLGNLEEATRHLNEFVRISEAIKQTESIHLVLVLQILGDIHESNKNIVEARKAWEAAQLIFHNNGDFVLQHPELGQNLTRRLVGDSASQSPTSFFQKLSNGFNRLSDEADTGSGSTASPHSEEEVNEVDVVQAATFMFD